MIVLSERPTKHMTKNKLRKIGPIFFKNIRVRGRWDTPNSPPEMPEPKGAFDKPLKADAPADPVDLTANGEESLKQSVAIIR